MALRDRVFAIKARDDTKPAIDSAEEGLNKLGRGFSRLKVGAAAAAAAIAAGLAKAVEQFNDIEDRLRSLNLAVYDFNEQQKQAQSNLLALGASEGSANAALAALAGGSDQLGLSETDPGALSALAAVEELGGDAFIARDLGRQFGLSGDDFIQQTRRSAAIAGAAGLPDFGQFQRYLSRGAPALQSLGLGLETGSEFFADVLSETSSVNAEQTIAGLNQFVRRTQAEGGDPRAILEREIERAVRTGSATPGLFGEGQLGVNEALSSGNVNLGSALDTSYLNQVATPESVAFQYNTAAVAEGRAQALATHSNPLVRGVAQTYGALHGGVAAVAGGIPFVGDFAETGVNVISPESIAGAANFARGRTQRREELGAPVQVEINNDKIYNEQSVGQAASFFVPVEERLADLFDDNRVR